MKNLSDRLDKIHSMAQGSLGPLTLMIVRRKFSPARLQEVVDELERAVGEMRRLISDCESETGKVE